VNKMARGLAAMPSMGLSGQGIVIVGVLIMLTLGSFVYLTQTETRTMEIDFQYDSMKNAYFASGVLPVAIKSVNLHASFSISAIPRVTLIITDQNGNPIQLIQGDFKFDGNVSGDLQAWFNSLHGKTVNFELSFQPNIPTISYPYLEITYLPLNFGGG
jgi:hypothetical protein